MDEVRVEIEGRQLTLSNLDKVFYPDSGVTKAGVVDYYARIAPVMVPHLAGRAVTLVRAPDGVDGERFFEKRCPPSAPKWVRRGGTLASCVVDDAPTLVWLANLAAIELHTHQHIVDAPKEPRAVVFDLDPGPPAGVLDCARTALDLRSLLDRLGLTAYVKTSGSKGLHLSVPLNGADPAITDDLTKAFALAIGRVLAEAGPDRVTVSMAKNLRPDKVFVDWSQNDDNKTTVAAYSLRIRPEPTVSAPLSWDEVSDALDRGEDGALTFETAAVLDRVRELGDLFAGNLTDQQVIPTLA
ncbi:MAG: non-homologous end-joining DNA ligase [Acidimicrobiia bacterium]